MKKKILLFTLISGLGYTMFTSESNGPALNSNNRSGAKASLTSCGPGGCHGTGTGPTVTITVDSGATTTAVNHYKIGQAYTIKIHGAGTTNNLFGFQFASVSGTGAAQVQAGTASGLPSGVTSHSLLSLNFIEHTHALTATSPGVYDVQFTWTAPSSYVGDITLYCTINSVNGSTLADPGDVSGNISFVLHPQIALSSPTVETNSTKVVAYPNPVVNTLNLQTTTAGSYTVTVYDMNGRIFANEQMNGQMSSINTANFAPGLYQVVVENENGRQVIPVVKQ